MASKRLLAQPALTVSASKARPFKHQISKPLDQGAIYLITLKTNLAQLFIYLLTAVQTLKK
jgi:hypothetical protein